MPPTPRDRPAEPAPDKAEHLNQLRTVAALQPHLTSRHIGSLHPERPLATLERLHDQPVGETSCCDHCQNPPIRLRRWGVVGANHARRA